MGTAVLPVSSDRFVSFLEFASDMVPSWPFGSGSSQPLEAERILAASPGLFLTKVNPPIGGLPTLADYLNALKTRAGFFARHLEALPPSLYLGQAHDRGLSQSRLWGESVETALGLIQNLNHGSSDAQVREAQRAVARAIMLPTLYQESALEAVRLAALGGLTDEETVEEYFKAVYRTLNQPGARYSLRSLAFQIGLPVVAFSFGALLLVAPQKARSV